MPELLKTSTDGEGKHPHYHIVYLREDGSGVTSNNDDHEHVVEYREPVEEIIDQDPNSVTSGAVLKEAEAGGWFVLPEIDHEHVLENYAVKEQKPKEEEGEIVEEVARRYCEAQKLEEDSREAGYKADDAYSGKHWDEKEKKKFKGKGRAAVTVNKTEGLIDNLTGYQQQNRTDIKYIPTEGGDGRVADILNIVVKNILEKCSFAREETKTFLDAAIVGRGLFNIYTDFERNIQGDIIVEKFKWDEASFGAHEKEDLSDCDIAFKEKWYSISKLKEMYPEKADKFTPEQRDVRKPTGIAEDWDVRLRSDEFVNTVTKEYKVVEAQRKVYKRVFILANSEDGFVFDAEGWSEKDVNAAKSLPGFSKIPRVSFKMRIIKIASTTLLEDDIIEDDEFSLVPLYAKFRNNEFWGKVKGVIELQQLINKSYSQFIDIINKVSNYGWFYDSETFPTDREKKKFKETCSSAGFLAEVNDVNKIPVKTEGVKFPSELVNAIAMFNQDIREIMNVNLDMQGLGGGADSGIAMKQKIVQQLIGNDFLFDNQSFAKKKLGQIIVKKIKKEYTPERILRIVASEADRDKELEINGRPFAPEDAEAIIRILRDDDLTKYDVIVSESSTSPSAMMGNFLAMLELAGRGVPIPPEAIMVFAPIPDKKKVMEALQNQQAQQAQSEDKKYDTEILKTQIANQDKTEAQPGQAPGQPGSPAAV